MLAVPKYKPPTQDIADRIIPPETLYQIIECLEGVIASNERAKANLPHERAVRDLAIIRLAYATSCRRSEIQYQHFRQDGYPIGSGTVEAGGKVVMQERMKQAGMRWSRNNAQAMLALRSILLSDRWDEIWSTLAPSPKLA